MKLFWLLIAVSALVAADDSNSTGQSDGDVEGRTRTSTTGKQQGRFFGGLGGLSPVGGLGPVGGVGHLSPLGGVGGVNPVGGFGVNPVLGGGFGVNPVHGGGFGVGPGIGGIVPGISPVAPPSACRYWCRTPEGQAYCCENISQPQSAAGVVKPGFCPPVRPVCPLRSFQPPFTCSNDGACGGIDKCCFDRCLGEHVCKPPLGIGR
ncbi:glycine-rich cell wall structural protein 1-like [Penaeus japonicus]|uniref:glycine-rich cell wall structural protein 1-like n=1 Tax=Penaeus japonicus TaxID=27405 RepID=UPI001C710DB1|nr:glycine-rich cell wall structural protein 1-like [Penaeus japonicus]